MIFYQFDPEMDKEILLDMLGSKDGFFPEAETNSFPKAIKENEEAYVFSNDEEYTGFLWLSVNKQQSLEIRCLFMSETSHSTLFLKKLLDFTVKRARYLKLSSLSFNRRIYDVECSQLKSELGCTELNIDSKLITCIL